MKPQSRTLTLVVFVLSNLAALCNAANTNEPPGVVEAARYRNLQEAIDSLPAGGGRVILPPGEFRNV
ncbi:MAG: hypothetical protein N3G20_07910, partial [Verrucomicrobiae bacterium]|nr:hypothetical protein [Verrucomicrobiae bacterium]